MEIPVGEELAQVAGEMDTAADESTVLRDSSGQIIPKGTADKMVLRTDNLVKKYGKRTVANHVSINVTQGEIVGLLGPNGAGKTTTFYMTVGLITPNEGQIFLNDLNITKYPVYKRAQNGIGYLAQEPSVFRKLSVENNIRAVLQMTNTSQEYQREKLESLISEFRLEKVRKNLGDQLSGGERRRTEIARCLAIDPKFIMLDEPFAGVDPMAVEISVYLSLTIMRRKHYVSPTVRTCCLKEKSFSKEHPRSLPKIRQFVKNISDVTSCSTAKNLTIRRIKNPRLSIKFKNKYPPFICQLGEPI